MHALRLNHWKSEPVIDEVPKPEPGPGEVVIRIGGAGACHSDLHLLHDFEAGMLPFEPPFTLGHENAGWVDTVGEGVTGFDVGLPVAVYGPWGCGRCARCAQGMENYCERQGELGVFGGGLGLDGGMAEYMLVPDCRLLVPLDRLPPVDAAPLTDAGLTPYHAIKRSQHLLTPGSTAVVIGLGGLGHMAVQILKAISPTKVIAVDQRPEALKLAEQSGADQSVLVDEHAADDIRGMTRSRVGADLVLDVVGSDATLALATAVSRPLGHVTCVGIAGGSVPFSFFGQPYEVSLATTYWGSRPELMEVIALAEAGKITPAMETVPLAAAADVYRQMADGKLVGRAVIVP